MPELEICCDNYSSAQAAFEGGADRVELCSAIGDGGLTPSYGMIQQVLKDFDIDVHVLIRPRAGDFHYSLQEIEIIKKDIQFCKDAGVKGIVIGFLNTNGSINKRLCREVVELSKPMKVVFHRAFDMTADPFQSLEDLIELGVDYVLTSGQEPIAMDGIDLLADLINRSKGNIKIMPGSGVRASNIFDLHYKLNAPAYHLSARKQVDSLMEFRQEKVGMGSESIHKEYQSHTHDVESIKKAKQILSK